MKRRITVFLVAVAAILGVGVLGAPAASATTKSMRCNPQGNISQYVYSEDVTYHVGSNAAGTAKSIMDIQWTNASFPVIYIQVEEGYYTANGDYIVRDEFHSQDGGHVTGSRVTGLSLISPTNNSRVAYLRLSESAPQYHGNNGYVDCTIYVNF